MSVMEYYNKHIWQNQCSVETFNWETLQQIVFGPSIFFINDGSFYTAIAENEFSLYIAKLNIFKGLILLVPLGKLRFG